MYLSAGENKSRTTLDLPGHQLELIKAVQATGKPVIVVFILSLSASIGLNKIFPEIWRHGILANMEAPLLLTFYLATIIRVENLP
jgi:hypothetical protein